MTTIVTWTTLTSGITESIRATMAARAVAILQPAQPVGSATWETSWADTYALAADLRARAAADGREIQIGVYVWGGLANPQVQSPSWPWITDARVLHRVSDGAGLAGTVGADPSPFRIVNLSDPNIRSFLVDQWVAWAVEHEIDIIAADFWWPDGLAVFTNLLAGPAGVIEDPDAVTPLWWCPHLAAYTDQLRWALESVGRRLFVNGISLQPFPLGDPVGDFVGRDFVNAQDYASGVLAEHVHTMYRDVSTFDQNLTMLKKAVAKHRSLLFFPQPQLFHVTDPTDPRLSPLPDWPRGDAVAKFYAGTYKLIEDPSTMMALHDGAAWNGFGGGGPGDYSPYVWDSPILNAMDIGHPLEPAQTDSQGVYRRRFSRGQAVVNAGDAAAIVQIRSLGYAWGVVNSGSLLGPGSVEMPPHSGVVIHDV
jgi:hypothetical protein